MDNIVTTIARNTVNLETLFAQGLTLGPHAIESFLRDSQSHLETIRGESTQIITFYNYAQHLLSESGMSIDALKKAPQDTITDENVRVAKQYLVLDYRIRINELYRELGKTTIDNDRLLYSLYNLTLNLDNIAHGYIYDLDASPPFI